MLQHCADACARQAELDSEMAEAIESKIGHVTSFFDLEAQDIDENVITFDEYKGKVTVITNGVPLQRHGQIVQKIQWVCSRFQYPRLSVQSIRRAGVSSRELRRAD